ncbi:hypothetical protein IVB18_40980 [Bradyrhizobium sp. 186]|uniref:hypothetical protein n=1 Tax=Bradyrhizobium sp. 186 TaxID=2782654 RepID=UPI002001D35C|nr:hypothetical protein [Bradyrhizobium sp. 186]UPK34424.1 hypothetical protein IVB18_40980 [Bradyrhizobium sp. 186]
MAIYPNANDQTNRMIAALDKIIEDYDNCIACSCGSVGRSQCVASQLSFFISLRQECQPSHLRKLTSTYSINVILP